MRYILIVLSLLCAQLMPAQGFCETTSPLDSLSSKEEKKRDTEVKPPKQERKPWEIGLRVGDPTGITAKHYLSDKHALEFVVGRTHIWGWKKYYDKRQKIVFKDDYAYKEKFPFSIQANYLYHGSIKRTVGWRWYGGIGGQFRYNKYRVVYKDNEVVREDPYTDIDIGVDFTAGVEYKLPKLPAHVFIDLNLFLELADNPFLAWTQGGFGFRYKIR